MNKYCKCIHIRNNKKIKNIYQKLKQPIVLILFVKQIIGDFLSDYLPI